MDKAREGLDAWRKGKTTTRGREAKRNQERLHFKFIVNYVKELHPEIFTKAAELYDEVKENNPNVYDLTKTVQFMARVTPGKPIPRYYYQRQTYGQQQQHQQHMVLQIPLLRPDHLPEPQPQLAAPSPQLPEPQLPEPQPQLAAPSPQLPEPQLPEPQPQLAAPSPQLPEPQLPEPQPQLTAPSPQLPEPQPQLPGPLPSPQLPEPQPQLPEPQSQLPEPSPLLLSPDVYMDMLSEIQCDPELDQIFNTLIHDDDDTMNELIWNNIYSTNDMTPLEKNMF